MQQLELLAAREIIQRDGLDIELTRDFLTAGESERILQELIETTPWEQPRVKVYGKWYPTPRLVGFHADPEIAYAYSATLHTSRAWTPTLAGLRRRVSDAVGHRFNALLLNYYRDGRDTIGWHADDEAELGARPIIASLSLGAAREMFFRPKQGRGERVALTLTCGSLLLMRGDTQHRWLHHLPRRTRCREPRLNLTFRRLYSEPR